MDKERYQRQLILKGFGITAQEKLAHSSVLVIGAGGLGCPVLQYLAAAGVGTIGIVDDDTVALSNLHRQILYTADDIGKNKALTAAIRLNQQNHDTKINTYPVRLDKNNISRILKDYQYIVDGTDNFDSRYLINDTCASLNLPLVFAAVSGYEGQVAIFNVTGKEGFQTNYRDLFPVPPKAGEVANCSENGVIGVLPGIVGTMQASEVIKLITGIGDPLVNKILNYNLLTQDFYTVNLSPDPNTYSAEAEIETDHEGYIDINATKLWELYHDHSALILDVREQHEKPELDRTVFSTASMSVFNQFIEREISQQNIILVCQHGIRSIAAAELLKQRFGNQKNVFSLKGGIVKWKDQLTNSKL